MQIKERYLLVSRTWESLLGVTFEPRLKHESEDDAMVRELQNNSVAKQTVGGAGVWSDLTEA